MKKLEINYSLSYSARDEDSRETYRDINLCFENPSVEEVAENLNIWLTAIKVPLKVVDA